MSASAPPPVPATEPRAPRPDPTFLNGLRGIWLFTWKTQATWRRLPLLLAGLLALPVVVYLTTSPKLAALGRETVFGSPAMHVNRFARQLERVQRPLSEEQRSQLLGIFTEEFARTATTPLDGLSGEAAAERERDEIKACYDRIHPRALEVLDEVQFNRFRNYEKLAVAQGQQQVRPRWGRTEPFYRWLVDFYFFVVLPLQCVRGTGGLIRDELQADTLGFLLTRPVSRARLLLLKYLSQTAWLQLILLVETSLMFAAGGLRQIPALTSLLALFLGAQFLVVMAWSALGLFLGLTTKRYLALALLYGLVVEMGIGRIPTNINMLSLIRHLKTILAHNPALQNLYGWTGTGAPLSVGALAFSAALFLTLAALLFTFKEYHQTAEMQK